MYRMQDFLSLLIIYSVRRILLFAGDNINLLSDMTCLEEIKFKSVC